LIALVATVVESIPFADVDNVTVMLSAIATAWLLIGPLGMWPVKFIVGLP